MQLFVSLFLLKDKLIYKITNNLTVKDNGIVLYRQYLNHKVGKRWWYNNEKYNVGYHDVF